MGFPQLMLIGRVMTDGRLNARVKWDLTDNLAVKANAQVNHFHLFFNLLSFLCACRIYVFSCVS